MSDEANTPMKPLDHEEVLSYTQLKRRMLVEAYTSEGKPPSDPKDVSNLLKALKDMDSSTLTNARNNIDESNADTAKRVADAMEVHTRRMMDNNPFRRNADGSLDGKGQASAPSASVEKLGSHDLVDGEDAFSAETVRADEFLAKMKVEQQAKYDAEDKDEL